jgi:putative ABC transport system permease protein
VRLLWLATRNLGQSPRRTTLLTLGLSVAVAVALLFFGFTQDTYDALAETFARSGQGHVQVAAEPWFDSVEPERHRRPVVELREIEARLKERSGDRLLASTVRRDLTGMVVSHGRSGVFLGVGTEPSAEADLAPLTRPVEGAGLETAPVDGVLLGQSLAQRLGLRTGDLVTTLVTTDQGLTNGADFVVVGLIRTGVRTLDRTLARFPLAAALELTGAKDADVLVLALRDTDDTDEVLAITRQLLTEYPGYGARPWYEQAHYYRGVKALYDRIFGVFQLLMLAVAGLGLSHAVAAVVAQRRAEIALLRVIGLKRRQVLGIFVLEGALLGLLGGVVGALLANLMAVLTSLLGGIPMPPPPGFADGYDAQFHLGAMGYLVVMPTTVITAMVASGAPALRAAQGALSRAMMAAIVLLTLVPASAQAQDRLARADAARAVPADQLCTVQLRVTEGSVAVTWEILLHEDQSVGHTLDLPANKAQAVLHDGETTWFQTASMRSPIQIGGSQRLAGGMPLAELLARPLEKQWTVVQARGDTLVVQARPEAGGAYATAELDFEGDRLSAARYAGRSGRVLRTATWTWAVDSVRIEVADASGRGKSTVLVASRPRCSPGKLVVDPEQLGQYVRRSR